MEKKEIFELIARHTRSVIPMLENHTFQPEDKFEDIGAYSLDRAEIFEMVMTSLSLDIPRIELYGAKDIGALVDLLYEAVNVNT